MVRVRVDGSGTSPSSSSYQENSDALMGQILASLRKQHLLPSTLEENLYLYPDVVVQMGDEVVLIKPLTMRLWLRRRAIGDAERIVEQVTRHSRPAPTGEREPARDVA
jgi:hypothetical protein